MAVLYQKDRRCWNCARSRMGDRRRRGFGLWCRRHKMDVGYYDYCPDWKDWMEKSHPHCLNRPCMDLWILADERVK